MNIRPHPKKAKTFVIKFWHNKRHFKKTIHALSYRDAENFAHRMRAEVAEGSWKTTPTPVKDMLMSEATSKFIEDYGKSRKKSWRQDLVYQRRCDEFFRGKMLSQITAHDVERFRTWILTQVSREKKLKDLSANRHCQFGKAVINKMFVWKLFAGTNPFKEVRLSDETKYQRDRALSVDEYDRLIKVIHPAMKPIIVVAVRTGLRPIDMRDLTKAQVNLESRTLHMPDPKSGKKEWVPLSDEAFAAIEPLVRALKHDDEKVFDFTGDQKRWRRARDAAKLKNCRYYDATRHTAGSWITMTSGLAATQRMLRHKDPKTTLRYSHWAEPVLRQVAAKLDQAFVAKAAAPAAAGAVGGAAQ